MTNKDDIFQNAQTISLHILDHTILLTCVSFSKKLPYLCFFSLFCWGENADFHQTLARASSIRLLFFLRLIKNNSVSEIKFIALVDYHNC